MLSQETVSKISTIVLRPGVYGVNLHPETNQVWFNVHGSLESINVVAELQFLFPELRVFDNTERIMELTNDRVADYCLHTDGLIITVTGWLPKEKDSAQDGANSEKLSLNSNTEELSIEEYLQREG
jgi:hypothetical protein